MPSLKKLQLIQVELNDEAKQNIRTALPDNIKKIQYLKSAFDDPEEDGTD